MGRQMVEQGRATSHLRVLRSYSKVILGPSSSPVPWTPVYSCTPPQTPGRSDFFPTTHRGPCWFPNRHRIATREGGSNAALCDHVPHPGPCCKTSSAGN